MVTVTAAEKRAEEKVRYNAFLHVRARSCLLRSQASG
jgi:hypothetical protein